MSKEMFSIRMRAAENGSHEEGGTHISGAESIVLEQEIERTMRNLINRAFNHERGEPDFLQITIDRLKEKVSHIPPLTPTSFECKSVRETYFKAKELLQKCNVSESAIEKGLQILASGKVVPGAYIMHSQTGELLFFEDKSYVRVSRVDWELGTFEKWSGLYHLSSDRIKEAVALASKVSASQYSVAELCWSDDPSYITGYVSSSKIGYVRLSPFKESGSATGGRIFFIDDQVDLSDYVNYLSRQAVILKTD
ncbi:6-carboxyhexanoate--CoA ligase [Alkalihalobacterium elongatum]|uniref:6-carboxyhexanoate--CoA ligase n=1 Tax=Alkalihalobacterium elongatum TaxID=2675466 RepID=UPI001C1FDBF9|nr:6-carboxyhexanoate--CoA ligase [Alkalihalobacterium elongatum]